MNPADRPATEPRTKAEYLRIGVTNRMILGGMSGSDAAKLLAEYIEAEAAQGAAQGAAPRAEGLPPESAERRLLLGLIDTLYGGAEKSDDLSDRLLAVAEVLDKVDSITDAYIAEKGADHLVSRGFQADLREASARLAAPRAEGLDMEPLIRLVRLFDGDYNRADLDLAVNEARAAIDAARLSRPSDERVPCLCGADENPNGPRLDIVCPKHDGELGVPESEER